MSCEECVYLGQEVETSWQWGIAKAEPLTAWAPRLCQVLLASWVPQGAKPAPSRSSCVFWLWKVCSLSSLLLSSFLCFVSLMNGCPGWGRGQEWCLGQCSCAWVSWERWWKWSWRMPSAAGEHLHGWGWVSLWRPFARCWGFLVQ